MLRWKRRHARVGLLGDVERKSRQLLRWDRVDQRAGGVVDPIHLARLVVVIREQLLGAGRDPLIEVVGEREGPDAPERDVAEDGGDGPVLVDGSSQFIPAESFDQPTHARELPRVLLDVVATLGHHSPTLPRWATWLRRIELPRAPRRRRTTASGRRRRSSTGPARRSPHRRRTARSPT